jgi:hypothetical protein
MPAMQRGRGHGIGSDASTVAGTEEARAFFQARLAVFGLALGTLSGASWVALAAVHQVARGGA